MQMSSIDIYLKSIKKVYFAEPEVSVDPQQAPVKYY